MRPSITFNRRHARAMQVTAQVMHIVEPYLNGKMAPRDVSTQLMDLFMMLGVEVITEADRIQAGLEPRDHNGMTLHEIAIIENRLIQAMLQPMAPFVLMFEKDS